MSRIVAEIWSSLKHSKLNNKWVKRITILVLLLFVGLLVKILVFPAVEKGEVANSLKEDWKDEARLIDKIKNGEEVNNDDYSDEIETSIKLFFVGANEDGLDLFSSVIDPHVLTDDFILRYDISDLLSKYSEAMNRISRNGQIESVEIVGSSLMIGSNRRRVVVSIKYLDLDTPIRVGIEVVTSTEEDVHDDNTDSYKQPLISHSIWDIIDIIETGAS